MKENFLGFGLLGFVGDVRSGIDLGLFGQGYQVLSPNR